MNSADSEMFQRARMARNVAHILIKRRYDVRNGKAAVDVDPLLLKRKGLPCLVLGVSRPAMGLLCRANLPEYDICLFVLIPP